MRSTNLNLPDLLAKAEVATPGPYMAERGGKRGAWIKGSTGEWVALACGDSDESADANAAYIAAANPARLIPLLQWIIEAEKVLTPFAEAADYLHPSQPDDGLTLDGLEVRDWRRARDLLSTLQEIKGVGRG